MNEPDRRWDEQLRAALAQHASSIDTVTPWTPPTEQPRIGRHPWRWLTPLAAAAAVLLIVVGVAATRLGAHHDVGPASPPPARPTAIAPTAAPSTDSPRRHTTPDATSPATQHPTTQHPTTQHPTTPTTTPTTTPPTPPDVFAQVTGTVGPLVLRSAVTGAVVRTLVPAEVGPGGSTTPSGGLSFAVVGPSGRYVYYVDVAGAARVPIGGGPVQQLPTPAVGGEVSTVFADRSDTRFEEVVGFADDSKPNAVYVTRLGSTAFTYLGSGVLEEADGWNPTGTIAYVTTFAKDGEQITGIPLATPTTYDPYQKLPCGGATTAVGPSGQLGWVVLSACHSAKIGRLTYTVRSFARDTTATVTLPPQKGPFYEDTLQYTPAGTAVLLELTPVSGCGVNPVVAVIHENSSHGVDLPGADPHCR